jgi:hypothetical protein
MTSQLCGTAAPPTTSTLVPGILTTLDDFDRGVAQAVGSAFPEWMPFAAVEESNGERAFVVSIEPPSRNVIYPLRIDTFGGEVTVSFDSYHAHFTEFCDGTAQDALTLIKKITSGVYAIASYWRDDQWCGSVLLDGETVPDDNEEYPYASLIRVRSWTGAFDSDIACIPRD